MKTKKIYVRQHSKEEAEIYAEGVLQFEGISKTDPAYEKLKGAYVENFLYQGVTKSLLPSEVLGMNPSTPRVNEKLFKSIPLFQKNGVFDSMKEGQEKKLIFRSSVASLTNIILEGVYNKRVKREDGKPSDKEFLPDGDSRLQTVKTHYLANAISTSLIAQIEPLLSSVNIDIDLLLSEIFGPVINEVEKEKLAQELHKEDSRYFFVKELYRRLKGNKQIEVRQNPKKKKRKKTQHRILWMLGAKDKDYVSLKLYDESGKFVGRDQVHYPNCPFKPGTQGEAIYEGPKKSAKFKKFEALED